MSSEIIRKMLDLLEYGPESGPSATYRDLDGRQMNTNISYTVEPTKVVAQLQSYNSQIYTKLGEKILRISTLEGEIKQLKEEVKQEGRDNVAALFSADDATRTRVVETVSFVFSLTKDPKASESHKYAEIIKELEGQLTPELIKVLEALKAKYKTSTQKSAALSVNRKAEESLEEGVFSKMGEYFGKFAKIVADWAVNYDSKLSRLKAQANMSESVNPDSNSGNFMLSLANDNAKRNGNPSKE